MSEEQFTQCHARAVQWLDAAPTTATAFEDVESWQKLPDGSWLSWRGVVSSREVACALTVALFHGWDFWCLP